MWKPIKDFEELYEISNCGEVRRIGGEILKLQNDSHGYFCVSLSKNGKRISKRTHRLVAVAFLDNPENLNVINHKDGNKKNNSVANLEWTTTQRNNQHAWDIGLNRNTEKQRASAVLSGRQSIKIAHQVTRKKVLCLNNGVVYNSITDAEQALGVDHSKISAVASGKRSHSHGYQFRYAEATS